MQKKVSPAEGHSLQSMFRTLLLTTKSLTTLLKRENQLLAKGQSADITKLLGEKQQLVTKLQLLEQNIKSATNSEEVGKLTKLTKQLTTNYLQLQATLSENDILLKSNIIVSKKIIEIYKSKYLEHTLGQFGYNEAGELIGLKRREKAMPSLNLNNKI